MRQVRTAIARAAVRRLRRWLYLAWAFIYIFARAAWLQSFCTGLGSRPRPILRDTVSSGPRLGKRVWCTPLLLSPVPARPKGSTRRFKPTGYHELPPGLLRGTGGPRRAGGPVRGAPGPRPGRGPQHRRVGGQHRPLGRGRDLAGHLGGLAGGPAARGGDIRPGGGQGPPQNHSVVDLFPALSWLTLHMPRIVSLGPRTEMQTAVPTREKGDFVAVHPVRVVRPRTIIYKKLGPEAYFPGPPGPPPPPPPLEGVPLAVVTAGPSRPDLPVRREATRASLAAAVEAVRPANVKRAVTELRDNMLAKSTRGPYESRLRTWNRLAFEGRVPAWSITTNRWIPCCGGSRTGSSRPSSDDSRARA